MKAAVALGANLGMREDNLRRGLDLLGIPILRVSSLYETDPVGPVPQGLFLNAVVLLETSLGPHALLDRLLATEARLGRVRTVPKGPRTLDLDLLLLGNLSLRDDRLTLPHPELTRRAFVLVPLLEIWPDARLPKGGFLKTCLVESSGVRLFRPDDWYPIGTKSGPPSRGAP